MKKPLRFQVLGYIAALFIFTVVPPSARAELPPEAYEIMQEKSPEALTIQVLSVKIDGSAIAASAKVTAVQRSASGKQSGDTIQIHYQVTKQIVTDPRQPSIVEEGKNYSAFLIKIKNGDNYGLAAEGASFTEPKTVASAVTPSEAELPQWRGQDEGGSEFSTQIIKTQKSWSLFWSRLSRPTPQALDESREMALFIAVGERSTGGYNPRVVSAIIRDGKLVIVYTDGKPSHDTLVTRAITHPWVVAIVPRTSLPMVTQEQAAK